MSPVPVVVEAAGGRSAVVAIVKSRNSDPVLRLAIQEAASRSGELVVLQLSDDPSVLRRSVAKAELTRDVSWWSRDLAGIHVAVEVVGPGSPTVIEKVLRAASCYVTDADTYLKPSGSHAWPVSDVVPTDHHR